MEDLSEVKHITLGDLPVSEITLGDTVVWQRPAWEPETQDILDYADLNGYTKPSYRYIVELNFFIWNLKRFELWDEVHDLIYWMKGDGDLNFKCINLVNTALSGTPNGGLISTINGLKSDGVSSSHIETNFNLVTDSVHYSLDDAYRGFYLYEFTQSSSTNDVDEDKSTSEAGIRNKLRATIAGGLYFNSNPSIVINTHTLGIHAVSRISNTKILNIDKDQAIEYDSPSVGILNSTLYVLRSSSNFGISEYSIGKSINLPQTQLLEWATEGKLTAIRNQETVDLIKYAIANDIKLPSIENLYKIDRRIHNLKKWGLWTNIFDVLYLLDGDGEANFRTLNIVNPALSGTPYGGLNLTAEGIEPNGVDGYIDTNFNPALLVEGQKYQLNDASRLAYVYKQYTIGTVIDGNTTQGNNAMYNSGTNTNPTIQRINNGIFNNFRANLSGVGIKAINRKSDVDCYAFNNNTITTGIQASTVVTPLTQLIFKSGNDIGTTFYGNPGISAYAMGKAITIGQSQIFTHILSGDIEKIHNKETKAVIEYAMDMGYKLPTLPYLLKLDQFIQDVKERGLWDKFDVLYAMRGDVGQCAEFRCINLVNPNKSGTPVGGVILTDLGIKGNGVDGYINSNFNPSLLVSGQKYQLNDASRIAYIYGTSGLSSSFLGIDGTASSTAYNQMVATSVGVGNARINQTGGNTTPWPDLSGDGFKVISRKSDTTVEIINNEILSQHSSTSTSILSAYQTPLKNANNYSGLSMSIYAMGSAITHEESQLLRQAILKYVS